MQITKLSILGKYRRILEVWYHILAAETKKDDFFSLLLNFFKNSKLFLNNLPKVTDFFANTYDNYLTIGGRKNYIHFLIPLFQLTWKLANGIYGTWFIHENTQCQWLVSKYDDVIKNLWSYHKILTRTCFYYSSMILCRNIFIQGFIARA